MNQWDMLSGYFDTHKGAAEINPGAADNILIAWPSVLRGIQMVQLNGQDLKALDYGCGGGSFAAELRKHGYSVVGCDSSPAMVAVAKKNLGDEISFYECDSSQIKDIKETPFDLITGIMVFQFVEDIMTCIKDLDGALKSGGVFAFAVFNPDYVKYNHGAGKLFDGFEMPDYPARGYMCLSESTKIPVFVRTITEYDEVFNSIGYHQVYADTPLFTTAFLKQYPTNDDTSCPEYLVLSYQKVDTRI